MRELSYSRTGNTIWKHSGNTQNSEMMTEMIKYHCEMTVKYFVK